MTDLTPYARQDGSTSQQLRNRAAQYRARAAALRAELAKTRDAMVEGLARQDARAEAERRLNGMAVDQGAYAASYAAARRGR